MERLTEKKNNVYIASVGVDEECMYYTVSSDSEEEVVGKLGRLEDIEEEIGIDLIILFKAFEEDIWIKFDNKIMFVPYDKKDFVFYQGNINCYPLKEPYGYTVSIDDYGKTWALTRAELK